MQLVGGGVHFLYGAVQGCVSGIGILFMPKYTDKVPILAPNYISGPHF